MHPAERDDLRRLAHLLLWLVPRDQLARGLHRLANRIAVKPWSGEIILKIDAATIRKALREDDER